jgi:hypothetical protein
MLAGLFTKYPSLQLNLDCKPLDSQPESKSESSIQGVFIETFKELFGENESILNIVKATLQKNLTKYEKTQTVTVEKQYSESQVKKIVKDSLTVQNRLIQSKHNVERENNRNLCIVQGDSSLLYTDNNRRCGKRLIEVESKDEKQSSSGVSQIEKRSSISKKVSRETFDQK